MKEVYPKRGSEDSWAHILCALFFEEVQFRDPETSSGISHIESIPASKKVDFFFKTLKNFFQVTATRKCEYCSRDGYLRFCDCNCGKAVSCAQTSLRVTTFLVSSILCVAKRPLLDAWQLANREQTGNRVFRVLHNWKMQRKESGAQQTHSRIGRKEAQRRCTSKNSEIMSHNPKLILLLVKRCSEAKTAREDQKLAKGQLHFSGQWKAEKNVSSKKKELRWWFFS